jgi:hypothetical protein
MSSTTQEKNMATKYYQHRWLVECDDERASFSTRAKARAYAVRLSGHPANANIRLFGPYTNVDGCARVIDLGSPDPDRVRAGKTCAYYLDTDEDTY